MLRPLRWKILAQREQGDIKEWLYPSQKILKDLSADAVFIPESYIDADCVITAYMPIGTGKTIEETLAKLNGTYDYTPEDMKRIESALADFNRWKEGIDATVDVTNRSTS